MTQSIKSPIPKLKVVVVNDDITQLNVLCGLLHKADLNPIPFKSAENALTAMLQDAPPALIITDLYMAGIDGWRFCRLLRSPDYIQLNQVPILVASATFSGDEPSRITSDLGANAFLSMPVDGQLFIEQVTSLLKGEKPQKTPKVLVVDHDKIISLRLTNAFEAHGYQANSAFTIHEGLSMIEKTAYDVAVLGYHLPDCFGDELLKHLQDKYPECVCIMIAADPQPKRALTWMKMGAAAYLPQPFEPEFLITLCEQAQRERSLLHTKDLLEVRTQQLRESEEKYRELVHFSSDPIFSFNLDETYRYVNEACARIIGKKPEQIIGNTPHEFFLPDEAEKRLTLIRQVFRTGEKGEIEIKYTATGGGERYYLTLADPVLDDQGKVLYVTCIAKDITERRKSEEALQKSEKRYRNLIEWMPEPVAVHRNGILIYVNPAAIKMIGAKSADELVGKPMLDWVYPVDRQAVMEEIKNISGGNYVQPMVERKFIKFDGTVIDVELQGTLIIFDGEPAIYVAMRDITERKRIDDALRESELRFRTFIEQAPIAIGMSRKGIGLYANPKFLEMFGLQDAVQTTGQVISKYIAPQNQEEIQEQIHRNSLGLAMPVEFEATGLRKDGSQFPLHASISQITLSDGVANISFITDITERKRAEEFNELLKYTIDISSDGSYWMDETGSFFYINEAGCQSLGYRLDELLQMRVSDINPRVTPQRWAEAWRQIKDSKFYTVESVHRRKDGTEFPVEITSTFVKFANREYINGFARDITDRKRAEDEVRRLNNELEQRVQQRTSELEIVNKELEAFSYSVSHDLRAPLRALNGFSDVLIADYQDQLGDQGRHYLKRIQEASRKMGELIEDLLDLSRVTRREMTLERVDLSLISHQIADELEASEPERCVEFKIAQDLIVQADASLMKIALGNLIHNAFKFTGKCDMARIQVGMFEQNSELIYFVRDNGVGFEMTYAEKLFKPFQRLHGIGEYPGTGIGLTIVQRIFARHGGRIWPESLPNQGTTFYFTLSKNERQT